MVSAGSSGSGDTPAGLSCRRPTQISLGKLGSIVQRSVGRKHIEIRVSTGPDRVPPSHHRTSGAPVLPCSPSNVGRSGRQTCGQTGCEGVGPTRTHSGVLLGDFSGSQKGQSRTSNDSQSQIIQQTLPRETSTISDDFSVITDSLVETGRLSSLHRSQGCVPSCANPPGLSQVPPLCVSRSTLSVGSTSVRDLHSPVAVYPDHNPDCRLSPHGGDTVGGLSGRSDYGKPHGDRSVSPAPVYHRFIPETWVDPQFHQVRADSFSEPTVHRGPFSYGSGSVVCPPRSVGQDTTSCTTAIESPQAESVVLADDAGSLDLGSVLHRARSPPITPSSDLSLSVPPEGGSARGCLPTGPASAGHSVVDDPLQCLIRRLYEPVRGYGEPVHRRVHGGLGGSPGRGGGIRAVVCRRTKPTYQLPRIPGCDLSNQALADPSQRQQSHDCDRQLDGGVLHQQTGRHSQSVSSWI